MTAVDLSRVRHFKSLAHLDPKQASRAAEIEAEMESAKRCIVPGCYMPPVTELCQGHQEMARG